MVNRHHMDLVVLDRLVELARRRFVMLPVGVPYHVVARVFQRMMRLRRYMLRILHVRLLAVDCLMALRRACEFRTRNTIRQAVDGGRQWWVGAGGYAHDRAAASSAGGCIHS
jgi:hypothetical protein